MKLIVGSLNPVKVSALADMLHSYDHLAQAIVEGRDVPSGVSEQPMTLEETVQGAKNRALAAFEHGDMGIGIESGLMQVPHTKSGHMDVCAVVIYDGEQEHVGLSSAWEAPTAVTDLMVNHGLDMNQAAYKAGLTDNLKVGSAEGLIGIMTKGRSDRKTYTQEALRAALIHLEPGL